MNLDPVFEQKPLLMYWVAQENLIEFLLQNGLSYILQIIVYVFLILVYPKAITSIFYDVLHVTWLCDCHVWQVTHSLAKIQKKREN